MTCFSMSGWKCARAFVAKLNLVTQYHLRGYSVWVLGLEDPQPGEQYE